MNSINKQKYIKSNFSIMETDELIFKYGKFKDINPLDLTPDILDIEDFNSVNTAICAAGFFSVHNLKKAFNFVMHIWKVCENRNTGLYSLHIVNDAYCHMIRNLISIDETEKAIDCYCQMTALYDGKEQEAIDWKLENREKEIDQDQIERYKKTRKFLANKEVEEEYLKIYLKNISSHPYHTEFSKDQIREKIKSFSETNEKDEEPKFIDLKLGY